MPAAYSGPKIIRIRVPMAKAPRCYRCGTDLAALGQPLGRLDECPACEVQVHVCRMCVYFDPQVPKQCREDDAEEVREKSRANFCDYFKPSLEAHDPSFAAADEQSRAQLDQLFGQGDDTDDKPDDDATAAEDLFK